MTYTKDFREQTAASAAVGANFSEAAEAIGRTYESWDGKEAIRLKMINKVYDLHKEGLFIKELVKRWNVLVLKPGKSMITSP